jgi:Pyruvate/2-oxoacid:ferredoxin oxidoreductase delta subunit/flavodoxin
MRTVIYWFSGTGNSLSAAKTLAEQCGDAGLVPISKAMENPPLPAERIGLVFPVYSFGPPALVARFVEKLNASPNAYIFAVVTYAGNKGGTLSILRRMLRKRGLDLSAGWGVKMPENFPPLGGAPVPEKQQAINASAAEKIGQIAAELRMSPRGQYESSMILWRLLSKAAYPFFCRFVRHADRFFSADANCNGCGICAKVCPVKDIEMMDGKPKWLGRCEQCYACFHWCPQKAVQYGRSAKQCRYHHPATALADFCQ